MTGTSDTAEYVAGLRASWCRIVLKRAFTVTWAADGYTVAAGGGRHQLLGWLRTHGIDRADLQVGVYVASHPLLGDVLIYSGPQRDARGRRVLAFGSTTEYAGRVHVQPLGMPPPPALRVRGEARAAQLCLRLPVAALLSGRPA